MNVEKPLDCSLQRVISKNEPTCPATSEIGRFLGQLATRQECKERQNRGRIEKRNDDIEKRGER